MPQCYTSQSRKRPPVRAGCSRRCLRRPPKCRNSGRRCKPRCSCASAACIKSDAAGKARGLASSPWEQRRKLRHVLQSPVDFIFEAPANVLGQARRADDSGQTERRNPASPAPSCWTPLDYPWRWVAFEVNLHALVLIGIVRQVHLDAVGKCDYN